MTPQRNVQIAGPSDPSRRLPGVLTKLALFSSVGLMVTVIGCGYALVGRGTNIPADIQSIFVQPFENLTPRGEIEQFITSAVVNELVTRQRFSIGNEAAAADAVLRGEITDFRVTPLTFDANGRATEYETTIIANVRFVRRAPSPDEEGAVLWSNARYLFRETYEIDASDAFFDQENIALDETAVQFAKTIVSDLLEGF